MKIKTASGIIKYFMLRAGFKGWTSFWETVYVLPGYENEVWLIRHEKKHLEQIARDGHLKFTFKYLFWLFKYGYYGNPYEIEARAAEKIL